MPPATAAFLTGKPSSLLPSRFCIIAPCKQRIVFERGETFADWHRQQKAHQGPCIQKQFTWHAFSSAPGNSSEAASFAFASPRLCRLRTGETGITYTIAKTSACAYTGLGNTIRSAASFEFLGISKMIPQQWFAGKPHPVASRELLLDLVNLYLINQKQ